jgi:hypothetical protein
MTTTLMELIGALTEVSEDDNSIVYFVDYLISTGQLKYC